MRERDENMDFKCKGVSLLSSLISLCGRRCTQQNVRCLAKLIKFPICVQGMFDCDGDRREFAKQQYQNFVARMDGGQQGDEQQQAQATQGAAVTNEGQ